MSAPQRVRLADVLAGIEEPSGRRPQLTRIWQGIADHLAAEDLARLVEIMLDTRVRHAHVTRILAGIGVTISHNSVARCRRELRRDGVPLWTDAPRGA